MSNYENGYSTPSIKLAQKIADIFESSIDTIFLKWNTILYCFNLQTDNIILLNLKRGAEDEEERYSGFFKF